MKKQIGLTTLSLMLVSPALARPAHSPVRSKVACQSVTQLIGSKREFSTLATAINAAGLKETLGNAASFTLFAPTNAAFARLPSDRLAALLNDPAALRGLVLYHVVGEKATAQQIRGVRGGTTLEGGEITVTSKGRKLMINNATVTKADLAVCNGIVHTVDTVLLPPAPKAGVSAPTASVTSATPAPPAAPASAANPATSTAAPAISIPALPASGGTVNQGQGNPAVAAPAPVAASAPVAAPAAPVAPAMKSMSVPAPAAAPTTDSAASSTVYDALVGDSRFGTLRDLISDADLSERLMTGEYTVFAPTDDAFANLPDGVLAAIRTDPAALKQLIQYHVVGRRLSAAQITAGQGLTTLQGSDLDLGSASLGKALNTANGAVYPIDAVLLPSDFVVPEVKEVAADTSSTPPNIAAYLTTADQLSTLRELLNTAGLSDTLASGDYTLFAPTNDAFAKLDQDRLAAWRKDKDKLRALLQGLIVTGHPDAAGLSAAPLKTLGGSAVTVTRDGSQFKYGNAVSDGKLTTTGSGNVYVIDAVPVPDSLR